jgi:hypothetical protein
MKRAADRFHEIFGQPARVHGAAGWQMNVHAYRQTQRLGFDYCSDTRGTRPFIPVVNAELIACPQVPTTLPGLMQLLAQDGMDAQRAAEELLAAARASNAPAGHVYTLHADFEGRKLLPLFEQVLSAWRAAGIALIALGDYLQAHSGELPRHSVHAGPADGILGRVALQGPEFLG